MQETDLEFSNSSKSILDDGVKGSFGFNYAFIHPTGNKYIGLAYEGKGGYAIKFKLFVYDSFFIGGSTGSSYFENKNPILTGNYDKTRVGNHYLYLGYEYYPINKLGLGASISLIGESRYKNEYKGSNTAYQIDTAKLKAYEAYIDYYINDYISLNLSYIYRNDKTKIKTSNTLDSRFNHAQFSNFGLGINLQFGKDPIILHKKSKK